MSINAQVYILYSISSRSIILVSKFFGQCINHLYVVLYLYLAVKLCKIAFTFFIVLFLSSSYVILAIKAAHCNVPVYRHHFYASELKTSRALRMKDIFDPTRKFEKFPFVNMHSVLFINKTVLENVQMGDNNSYCKCRTGYSKLTDKLPTVCIQSKTLDKFLDFLDRKITFL
jgi:hypothetical protein